MWLTRSFGPATTTYSTLRRCETWPTPSPPGFVDTDLGAHVAFGVEGQDAHVPAGAAHVDQFSQGDPRLVVVGDHCDPRGYLGDHLAQGGGHLALLVEDALCGVVAAVDALAGDAVVSGSVPGDQRLPYVIVGEIPMLVVRRVDVRQVDRRQMGE